MAVHVAHKISSNEILDNCCSAYMSDALASAIAYDGRNRSFQRHFKKRPAYSWTDFFLQATSISLFITSAKEVMFHPSSS